MRTRPQRGLVALTGFAVVASSLLAPLAVAAEENPELEYMTAFPVAEFATEAAQLPDDLVEALERDVQLTPEEYLAQAAAAQLAVEVVDGLEEVGVDVLDSRLEGTELIVNVDSEADAALVESVGATVEFGEPEPRWDPESIVPEFVADVYGGQGWIYNASGGQFQCSLGFGGVSLPAGTPQISTAGHCTEPMVGTPRILNQSVPGQAGTLGITLGERVASTTFLGSGLDIGRIGANGHTLRPAIASWGGGAGAPLSTTRSITGDAQTIVGATICKSGSRTGWSCGVVVETDYDAPVCIQNCPTDANPNPNPPPIIKQVWSAVAQICVRGGDSGGTAVQGNKAIGITSWGTSGSSSCNTDYAGFFQMVSPTGKSSVATAYSGTWELGATVSAPTITQILPAGGNNTTINGSVPGYGVNYKVDVRVNGSSTIFATANVNPGNGTWSVNVASLPQGIHSFTAVARYGTQSTSAPTNGFIRRGIDIQRIQAPNRFSMAIEIAKKTYPSGNAPVVYVTTGSGYADALSAGPAAALQGGVMLLTQNTALPIDVKNEIIRLNPGKIVVVGGTASVSAAVYNELAALQSNIVRQGGANRFEASRNIVADAFLGEQPNIAYIATGNNFPDALGASAAGGAFGYPVILVNGTTTTIDSATMQLLSSLGVTQVKVAGGPNSVSSGIFNAIKAVYPSTIRLSGADRFVASTNIALDAFGSSSPDLAYLATGLNFPDALAGGPLAATTGSPLLAVKQACVPRETLAAFRTLGVTKVTLLGGTASLTPAVQSLTSCP